MAIAFIAFAAVCLSGIRVRLKNGNSDYLSIEQTLAVKGFFIILVFSAISVHM